MKEYVRIAWREIRRRKLRSFLTLIGIIIAIAAIVSLVSLGQGLENEIEDQLNALGNDKLFISPKGSALTAGLSIDAVKITQDDRDVVADVAGVERTAGFIFSTAPVEFNDVVRYHFIYGNPSDPEERKLIGESQNYKIGEGRSFEKGEKFKGVLGINYKDENLFGREAELGDKIFINGYEFKTIGIWQRIGNPPDDKSISIPLETFWEIFAYDEEEFGLIVAQVGVGEDIEKVAEDIEEELRDSRGLEEGKEDFQVETPLELVASFNTILNIVQMVIVGIASISLLVGGVGIMNTMYTSVLQRTKEIGIMKAIGARNRDILILFIVESGFYGLIGGILGGAIGLAIAKGVELLLVASGTALISVRISWGLIVFTLLFSFIVGMLSGIAPARKAASLNPVESLRYE